MKILPLVDWLLEPCPEEGPETADRECHKDDKTDVSYGSRTVLNSKYKGRPGFLAKQVGGRGVENY